MAAVEIVDHVHGAVRGNIVSRSAYCTEPGGFLAPSLRARALEAGSTSVSRGTCRVGHVLLLKVINYGWTGERKRKIFCFWIFSQKC